MLPSIYVCYVCHVCHTNTCHLLPSIISKEMEDKLNQARKRINTGQKAFHESLQYDPKDIVFGTPELKVFLSEKGRKLACDPRMMLPGLLGSTSNAMGTCKVISFNLKQQTTI